MKSDPELELLRLRRRHVAVITTRGLEPFQLNVENDESLQWPAHLQSLPAEKDTQVASEKLDVGSDVMDYLRDLALPKQLSTYEMVSAFLESDRVSLIVERVVHRY